MSISRDQAVIVTGATGGIGLACARSLAGTGVRHLILLGRDAARLAAAASDIGHGAQTLRCDLSSMASVRAAATEWESRVRAGTAPPLAGLVLNAGLQTASGPLRFSPEGYELTFATNHLGHFLLALLLLPGMAEPGRIVVTSSGTHDPSTIEGRFNRPYRVDAEALARPAPGRVSRIAHLRRYSTSKLCNLLFAYELDRKLRAAGRDITCNALDPGAVPATGLLRDSGRMLRALVAGPLLRWSGVRVETPEAAGAALARLVLDPALEGVGGRYFAGLRETRSSVLSYDESLAAELWRGSLRLCGMPPAPAPTSPPTAPLNGPEAGLHMHR